MQARPCHAPTDTPCLLQYGQTALDVAGEYCDDEVKKEEVTAVLRRVEEEAPLPVVAAHIPNHRRPPPALGVLGLAAGRIQEELERSKEREKARAARRSMKRQAARCCAVLQAAGLRPEDDEVSPHKDENHGVQYYLSVIESPAMDSKKTQLLTAMLSLETRPHVLKVFSETATWRGQGEQGYFHGAPEDWNFVAAALREAPPGDDDTVEEHGEAAAELERERAATAELRRTEVRLMAEHSTSPGAAPEKTEAIQQAPCRTAEPSVNTHTCTRTRTTHAHVRVRAHTQTHTHTTTTLFFCASMFPCTFLVSVENTTVRMARHILLPPQNMPGQCARITLPC